jgi:peptidoglycan/LPS O-acetylase OafA/YrhL
VSSATAAAPTSPPATAVREGGDTHYLAGIEALRAVAASAVVFHHCYTLGDRPAIRGSTYLEGLGGWGVDIFFLLSAFLLCEYFWRPRSRWSLRAFYLRRFLRIGPAYYVCVAVLFLVLADHALLTGPDELRQVIANATFTHWLAPSTASSLNVDGALWTLSIEMLLYLSIPIMALLMGRRPHATFLLLCAAGLGYRLYVARSADPLSTWVFGGIADDPNQRLYLGRQFLGYLPLFAVGMYTRWLIVNRRLPARLTGPAKTISALRALVLLVPSLLLLHFVYSASNYVHWFWFSVYDMACGVAAVSALVYLSRWVLGRLSLLMRGAVWLGRRSYGLYLWHFPVVLLVYQRGPQLHPPHLSHEPLRIALIWVVAVTLAALSYRLVEKPAMDLARRLCAGRFPRPARVGVTSAT